MDRCRRYEAATKEEGPHEPQEMITSGRPLPPPPLEHSDEEEGLEPWEVVLGHCACGGYEATEGPYVLQEMITDVPPPPPPPPLEPAAAAEHGDKLEVQDLEPWEVVLGHCEAAEGPYVPQEMITGGPLPPPPLEPAAAAEHSDEDLEPWEIEPEPETGARRYPEEMVPG